MTVKNEKKVNAVPLWRLEELQKKSLCFQANEKDITELTN